MDNLSSHKVNGVRQRIEQRGAELLYLPPYSPDLNPIEKAWSKLKQLLRAAKSPFCRSSRPGHLAVAPGFSPANAQAWFRLCFPAYI